VEKPPEPAQPKAEKPRTPAEPEKPERPHFPVKRQELVRLIFGKDKDEVQRLLDLPFQTYKKGAVWRYFSKTYDAETRNTDNQLLIVFEGGKVALIQYLDVADNLLAETYRKKDGKVVTEQVEQEED
jgi:hypothetical protein